MKGPEVWEHMQQTLPGMSIGPFPVKGGEEL